MTGYEDQESDDDVEDDIFGFFQLLFLTSWYQYEPSSIDNEDHTEDCEEGIQIIDQTSDDTDTFLDILILYRTATRPEKVSFLAIRSPVYRRDKCTWQTDEKKSDKCIDHDVFSLLQLLLIASARDDDEKCIHHHPEESESGNELEEIHYRGEYIDPELPSCHRPDHGIRVSEEERIPYRECELHDKYPDRDPDDIALPALYFLFIWIREEELDHSENEKERRDNDKEILDREGDIDKGIRNPCSSWFSCWEKEFPYRSYEIFEQSILISSRIDSGIAEIELLVSECPEWRWVEEDEKWEEDKGEEFHMRRFRCPLLYRFSREMQSHAECTIDKVYIEWGNIWQNRERERVLFSLSSNLICEISLFRIL